MIKPDFNKKDKTTNISDKKIEIIHIIQDTNMTRIYSAISLSNFFNPIINKN